MINACLNGDRHPRVHPRIPVTPSELAEAAVASIEAGAEMVHIHPRDLAGNETFRVEPVVAALNAIRERVATRISVTTRDGIVESPQAKLALIREWPGPDDGGPDCASVNWHEPGAEDVAKTLRLKGIGVEAGIWSPAAATQFVSGPWPWQVERVLVELIPGYTPGSQGTWAAERVMAALGMSPVPVLVHGENDWAWPVLRWAKSAGHDVRIGLEDTLVLPSGSGAMDNADLVRAARDLPLDASTVW